MTCPSRRRYPTIVVTPEVSNSTLSPMSSLRDAVSESASISCRRKTAHKNVEMWPYVRHPRPLSHVEIVPPARCDWRLSAGVIVGAPGDVVGADREQPSSIVWTPRRRDANGKRHRVVQAPRRLLKALD